MKARLRQSRNVRRAGTKVRLGPRDEALIRAVGRFRLCRSSDLARLFFPGRHRDVVADRLRRLYDGQILDVHVRDRAAQNVYSLGPAGRRWLSERGIESAAPPRADHDHHLGIIECWSRLATSAHASGVQLVRVVPEWEIRGAGRPAVIPDARIELRRNDHHVHVALEVDLGTEGAAVLRDKLRSYTSAFGPANSSRESLFIVLATGGKGVSRTDRLAQLLRATWPGEGLVVRLDEVGPSLVNSLLGSAESPDTGSLCGNGRDEAASEDTASAPTVTGAEPSDA